MQSSNPSIPSKKQLHKSTSAKKILKQLLYPVKLCVVPHKLHATTNQAYSTYYSHERESDEDRMYADLTEEKVYTSIEIGALSINDDNSTHNIDDPKRESKNRDIDDHIVDDSIFEDFIRRNREQFVREKEETASLSMGQQGSSGHYIMDDWIFEEFIRRNRNRFQHEKEEIISIDDFSDDELDDSVAY